MDRMVPWREDKGKDVMHRDVGKPEISEETGGEFTHDVGTGGQNRAGSAVPRWLTFQRSTEPNSVEV